MHRKWQLRGAPLCWCPSLTCQTFQMLLFGVTLRRSEAGARKRTEKYGSAHKTGSRKPKMVNAKWQERAVTRAWLVGDPEAIVFCNVPF